MGGRDLPQLGGRTMEWPVGSAQYVSWQFGANHGGGYAYRLCPTSESMSEECFQRHHLAFVGETSWIQFGWNQSNRTAIQANRTSRGTHPQGSQWTKVPIPSCSGPGGGYDGTGCDSPQFPTPIPGLWGNGPTNGCAYNPMPPAERAEYCGEIMDFRMVDLVKIPENLPLGEYVLSFRWDCEQTHQIWTQCADVKITATGSPSPIPLPGGGCCKFGSFCGDCGPNGAGWCHKSASNCAACEGSFDSSGIAPSCSGSPSPSPPSTSAPAPPTGGGCCKFGSNCGDCGTDGTGWCHLSASNCAACSGSFDSSANAPSCSGSHSPSLRAARKHQSDSFSWIPRRCFVSRSWGNLMLRLATYRSGY